MDDHLETGMYILRSLIKNIALPQTVKRKAVTSPATFAGEILHHVRIAPDPNDASGQPFFILASRQKLPMNQPGNAGVQQILLLASVGKACILSNNTLNFYTLPELSPAFPHLKPLTCGWTGGIDLDSDQNDSQDGIVVMLCLRSKIRLVKIAEEPLRLTDIEFGGCLSTVRRGNFACIADTKSYTLLDFTHQQKIPLFSISSVDDQSGENADNVAEDVWFTGPGPTSRNVSPSSADLVRNTVYEHLQHRKNSSLGVFRKDSDTPGQDFLGPSSSQRYGFDSPLSRRSTSWRVPAPDIATDVPKAKLGKPFSPPIPEPLEFRAASPSPTEGFTPLRPLIAFLLSRNFFSTTIEFASYPEALVVDGKGSNLTSSETIEDGLEEGFVVAVVRLDIGGSLRDDVEIHRRDMDPGGSAATKEWLHLSPFPQAEPDYVSLRSVITIPDITDKLALKPIRVFLGSQDEAVLKLSEESATESRREEEEKKFIQRLCHIKAHMALWRGDKVFWLLRNPTVLKLDFGLFSDNLLHVVKRFLLSWRRKKGNPSVTDGAQVFPTVDAALLHVLILLDSQSNAGISTPDSLTAEHAEKSALVVEYGTWLANRNPELGVQVFTDENSRAMIPTNEALLNLREKAANAVKVYLEYLVFQRKILLTQLQILNSAKALRQLQHMNELIAYSLDIVFNELKFAMDNIIDAEWWHSRIHLLYLLDSCQGPASSDGIVKIRARLEPYAEELMPEMVIMNGRQGKHKEALCLLTHGLGDFDPAIRYCLFGGSNIYYPTTEFLP
ncbi:hypothetical protein K432DRAFT_408852 [Lepidopterella palustris CBS 459.81]|uniref:CNH domain-containing protein n=1 Tax=Lepidopterella palustris CBS 459.81 TaxID=1314670 RepID=A0A8E2JB92_9PEZI|nr:hypothetical protein K432DRAFT_408852 [Lepidopterella palustris CBS 459.81]